MVSYERDSCAIDVSTKASGDLGAARQFESCQGVAILRYGADCREAKARAHGSREGAGRLGQQWDMLFLRLLGDTLDATCALNRASRTCPHRISAPVATAHEQERHCSRQSNPKPAEHTPRLGRDPCHRE